MFWKKDKQEQEWIINKRRKDANYFTEKAVEEDRTDVRQDSSEENLWERMRNRKDLREENRFRWRRQAGGRMGKEWQRDHSWLDSLRQRRAQNWEEGQAWNSYPSNYDYNEQKGIPAPWRWMLQSAAALVIFLSLWGVFLLDYPWAKQAQISLRQVMTEDWDFAPLRNTVVRLGLWTDGLAAAPVWAPSSPAAGRVGFEIKEPVSGLVVTTYGQHGQEFSPGIVVKSLAEAPVISGTEGKVLVVWKDKSGLFTVQIGGTDGAIRVYGYLGKVEVKAGEQVQASTRLGTLSADASGWTQFYYEVRKDGKTVDPLNENVKTKPGV